MDDVGPLGKDRVRVEPVFEGDSGQEELPDVVALQIPLSLGVLHDHRNDFLEVGVDRSANLKQRDYAVEYVLLVLVGGVVVVKGLHENGGKLALVLSLLYKRQQAHQLLEDVLAEDDVLGVQVVDDADHVRFVRPRLRGVDLDQQKEGLS